MPPDVTDTPQSSHLERVLRLRTLSGFEEMTPNEVASIAENTVDRFFPAGTHIYAEGEPVTALHYVLTGRVAVRRKGVTVQQLEAPAVVGGLGALARLADGQEIIAEQDCWTLEMHADAMEDVFEDNFALLLMVMRAIAGGFIEARQEAGATAGFRQILREVEPPSEQLSLVEKIFYLRQSIQFASGRIEMLIGLARSTRERRIPAGTELWKRGDRTGGWLILVSGVVACRGVNQQFKFGPGDAVGGLDALANVPRWFDATAETDLVALEIDPEVLIDLFEDSVDLALQMCRRLATLLIEMREENARMRSEQEKARAHQEAGLTAAGGEPGSP